MLVKHQAPDLSNQLPDNEPETESTRLDSTAAEYQSLTDIVYQRLKTVIITGSFEPGSRLSDRDISNTMNVSTTTVKRALNRLHSEGLVEIRPRRGTFVVDLSSVSIEENGLLRAAVEGTASRLAARKATERDVESLTKLLEDMRRATENFQLEHLIDLNTRFHDLIHQTARNQYLKQLIEVLRSFDVYLRKRVLRDQHEALRSYAEHKAIVEAIAARDEESAEQRTRNHVIRTSHLETERR